jgi:hypothetical protein
MIYNKEYYMTLTRLELLEMQFSEKQIDDILESSFYGITFSNSSTMQESVKLESLTEGRVRSIKYIIKFNLSTLFESVVSLMGSIASLESQPWLAKMGFLVFLKQMTNASTVKLNEDTCKVLFAINLLTKENIELSINNIKSRVNSELKRRKFEEIKLGEIKDILSNLEDLGIIEQLGSKWMLIDFIQVNKETFK